MKLTDAQMRATKAAAHNIRTVLQNAIAADFDAQIVERLRALSLEIEAVREERDGGDHAASK